MGQRTKHLRPKFTTMETSLDDKKHNGPLNKNTSEKTGYQDRLREDAETYRKLVESSLTGIYIDQDGKIIFANRRFAEIYGYSLDEVIGMESQKLIHPEYRDLTDERRAKRLKGEKDVPEEYDARGLTKEGATLWIRRRNTDINYRGRTAILGNITDITDQKRVAQELKEANQEMKIFVDTLTHDLKAPIIAIQGFSSRLRKKYGSKLGVKAMDYLERIKTSADLLEAWVNDLRTLQQAGRIHYDMEDVSTIEIVEQLKAALQIEPGKSAAEIDIQQPLPVIHGDKTKIYEVFQNLLTNAIKSTRDIETPRIEIGYEEKAHFHQFHIRDNGIGIDPKNHKKIFERFRRIKGPKSSDGTGLGLAIVARIIEHHKGEVWVESEKGKGATFYFTFPKEENRGQNTR